MGRWKHDHSKPVIGISGGIGAGKSTVARLFGELGCCVIDSDALAHEVLQTPEVKAQIRAWLGEQVFDGDGSVNRRAVGKRVFSDPGALEKLNKILHPRVGALRAELQAKAMGDPAIKAVVWDTPLLFETVLDGECDATIFVNALAEKRLERVMASRGWTGEEVARREKMQLSLDKKAKRADYSIDNTGDVSASLRQVQRVLSQIFKEES